MRPRRAISLSVGTAALVALAAAPSLGAAGCSPDRCVPRTGTWTAPSPQKLTSPFGPTNMRLKVIYRRDGKKVKSRYGNTVRDLGVYLRYFCPEGSEAEWVETGFLATGPIKLDRDGKVTTSVLPYLDQRKHRLVLKFKRTTFSGRLSGSAKAVDGTVCNTSVSFSGKRK